MAVTLIINPGSSSKKYSLVRAGRVVSSWRFERNEQLFEVCVEMAGAQQKCEGVTGEVYGGALRYVLDTALRQGVITHLQDITAVGLRVVAPGTYFQSHRVVTLEYEMALRARTGAAPLHIPHTLREIEQLKAELPEAVVVGVSDSAFHATLPPAARNYAIEQADTEQFDIHRFGYHGLSYASIAARLPSLVPAARRVIVCHIGSGMSMCALRDGLSVETTMGFGPGSGLMMGARTGDIDASALFELMRVKNMKPFDAESYLQSRGGFVGLADEADFRHLLERQAQGDEAVQAAFDLCRHHLHKTIGAYTMLLGGLDAIVLTATAMERSPQLRQVLFAGLEWAGIALDAKRNDDCIGRDGLISPAGAAVALVVARTDEFGELLRETSRLAP